MTDADIVRRVADIFGVPADHVFAWPDRCVRVSGLVETVTESQMADARRATGLAATAEWTRLGLTVYLGPEPAPPDYRSRVLIDPDLDDLSGVTRDGATKVIEAHGWRPTGTLRPGAKAWEHPAHTMRVWVPGDDHRDHAGHLADAINTVADYAKRPPLDVLDEMVRESKA